MANKLPFDHDLVVILLITTVGKALTSFKRENSDKLLVLMEEFVGTFNEVLLGYSERFRVAGYDGGKILESNIACIIEETKMNEVIKVLVEEQRVEISIGLFESVAPEKMVASVIGYSGRLMKDIDGLDKEYCRVASGSDAGSMEVDGLGLAGLSADANEATKTISESQEDTVEKRQTVIEGNGQELTDDAAREQESNEVENLEGAVYEEEEEKEEEVEEEEVEEEKERGEEEEEEGGEKEEEEEQQQEKEGIAFEIDKNTSLADLSVNSTNSKMASLPADTEGSKRVLRNGHHVKIDDSPLKSRVQDKVDPAKPEIPESSLAKDAEKFDKGEGEVKTEAEDKTSTNLLPNDAKSSIEQEEPGEDAADTATEGPIHTRKRSLSPCVTSSLQHKRFQNIAVNLVDNIQAHRYSSPFLQAVNAKEAPDYHSVIYEPKDLKTILKAIKLKNDPPTYQLITKLKRDILLMLANCIMYNKSDSALVELTKSMKNDVNNIFNLFEEAKLEQ